MLSRSRRRDDKALTATRKVDFGQLADSHDPRVTYVERPDQWTAVDHAAAVTPVDRDAVTAQVRQWVHDALAVGSVDDLNADLVDARIDAMLMGWNAAVVEETRHRLSSLLQLRAMERRNLTEVQSRVASLRAEVDRCARQVAAWRRVLLGARCYDPEVHVAPATIDHVTAPAPIDLQAVFAMPVPRARRDDDGRTAPRGATEPSIPSFTDEMFPAIDEEIR